ncbi:hypothetical protein WJX75_004348 [Coccomyxa subellipsoidea]|uniref:Bromo domain-containing protein n=1 Tax=Coccomyxa subellipsoidea TaxID=248742 RepID=A0ABR2YXE9_9CHLO
MHKSRKPPKAMGSADSGHQPQAQLHLRGGTRAVAQETRIGMPLGLADAALSEQTAGTDEEGSPELDIVGTTEEESQGGEAGADEDTGASPTVHPSQHSPATMAMRLQAAAGMGGSPAGGDIPTSQSRIESGSRHTEAAGARPGGEVLGRSTAHVTGSETSDSEENGGPSPFMRVTGAFSPEASPAALNAPSCAEAAWELPGVDDGSGAAVVAVGEASAQLLQQRQLERQGYRWPSRAEMSKPPRSKSSKKGHNRGTSTGLSAHARMRELLKEVLGALSKRVPRQKRLIFMEQVDQLHVPDYCVHVPPENEVWISRIRKRVNDGTHASIASLVKDFEQLLANCRAYNTPGNGKLGSPFLIGDAEELLRVVKEEGQLRAQQFEALDAQVAEEAVRGVKLEPAQPVHRAAVVLPAGFSVREVVSAAKPRGYIEYVAACPIHGAGKRLDRWKEVADFMRAHHGCREEWAEWAQHEGEEEEEYFTRVRETFHFKRSEMPRNIITRVHVTGHYGSQRTGQSTGSGSSRGSVPKLEPPRTWHADADQPARVALLAKIRESLARMRDAYPQRSYPPEGELEQILYEAAKTEAEFSCEADFDERLQRAIGLTVLRSHAQAATPLSPTSAHRSMTNNCDMLLTAADHVEESEPGTNHSAEDSPALTCQSFAVGARAPLGGSSGGPPTQGGGWQGTGVAMGIPVTGRVPAAPGVLPATAGWQPQPQQSAPLQQAAQPRPPPSQAAPKQALPPIPERAADMRHPILEGAAAASSAAPAGNNLHSSIVKAGQDAAFAQLQLSRPLQRPQPPAQTASSFLHPHASLPVETAWKQTARKQTAMLPQQPQPPARQKSVDTATSGSRQLPVTTGALLESVPSLTAPRDVTFQLPAQHLQGDEQGPSQLPVITSTSYSHARPQLDESSAALPSPHQQRTFGPAPMAVTSQAPDKLQDLWLYLEPLLDAQQHGRLKAHFDAYKVLTVEERRQWGNDLYKLAGPGLSSKINERLAHQSRAPPSSAQNTAGLLQPLLGYLAGQPTQSGGPAPLAVNTGRAPNQALGSHLMSAARSGSLQFPQTAVSPRHATHATAALGQSPLSQPALTTPTLSAPTTLALLQGGAVSPQFPSQQLAQSASAKVQTSMHLLKDAMESMNALEADNARLQAHVTQLSSLLQASEARRSSAEAAANRAAVALEAAAREKAALLDAAATAKVALMQASAKENAKLSLELARMRMANASLEMHLRTLESPGAGGPAGAGLPAVQLGQVAGRVPSSSPVGAPASAAAQLQPGTAATSVPAVHPPTQASTQLNEVDVSRATAAALNRSQPKPATAKVAEKGRERPNNSGAGPSLKGAEQGSKEAQVPSWVSEETVISWRTALPEPQEPLKPFSLWQALKDLIGKDILDAPLPIGQYCPLTELQFRAEELEYTELLDQAAELPKGSMERLLLVAAFAQIGYSAGLRPYKCFNPVMGETFEVVRPEKGMRAVMEAVHQDFVGPTRIINAWHAEGAKWELSGEDEPRVRFWGSSVDLHLNWTDVLTFSDGDTYSWRKGTSNISGLISGNLVITHKGTLSVTSHSSGATVHLTFKEPGMFSSKKSLKHEMTGVVELEGKKLPAPTISGHFDTKLVATMADGSTKTLWEKRYPPGGLGRCHFSEWTASLNEIPQGHRKRLPPTDARLRPDVRALENGCYDKADALKRELTARIRAHTLENAKKRTPLQPRWFELKEPGALTAGLTTGTAQRYRFTREYWKARRNGSWSNVSNLYGQ